MSIFDFSEDVERAIVEATDEASRLSAKTSIHRAKFPGAVKKAGFQFLTRGGSFLPGKHDLVVGAAPWSDGDLNALEGLVPFARSGRVRISVFDIDDIPFNEMIRLLPGMRRFVQTPVALQYREGKLTYLGEGHDAVLWMRQL